MPPRYAYWTILVDDQPTAFRAAAQEDLMPTFKRLKEKQPSAKMVWFQNGKVWPSRVDAQEAMRARGEMGRRNDARQGGGFRDRNSAAEGRESRRGPKREEKLEWKPKGEFTPAPKRSFDRDRKFAAEGRESRRSPKGEGGPEWKPKDSFDRNRKPEWKPKGSFDRDRKPEWKPKGSFDRDRKPDWKGRERNVGAKFSSPARGRKPAGEKLEWKPKATGSEAEGRGPRRSAEREGGPEKRKWIPKAEYKKAQGIEAPRDKKWRPGGEHRDPKQKYKDAKKAKWSKFKKNIRSRWESKQGKPAGDKPFKKRRDEE